MGITYRNGPLAGQTFYVGQVTGPIQEKNYEHWTDCTITTFWLPVCVDGVRKNIKIEESFQVDGTFVDAIYDVVVDVSQAELELAEFRDACDRACHVTSRLFTEANRIGRGQVVTVHKGRKVPLGDDYMITSRVIESQYGLCVHLTAKTGETYMYVSIENIRVSTENMLANTVRQANREGLSISCQCGCGRSNKSGKGFTLVHKMFHRDSDGKVCNIAIVATECVPNILMGRAKSCGLGMWQISPINGSINDVTVPSDMVDGELDLLMGLFHDCSPEAWAIYADFVQESHGDVDRAETIRRKHGFTSKGKKTRKVKK